MVTEKSTIKIKLKFQKKKENIRKKTSYRTPER